MKNSLFINIAVLILAVICGFTACGADPSAEDFEIPEIAMVQIPPAGAGDPPFKFWMGSFDGEVGVEMDRGEQPRHEVTLTKRFRMGMYQITQGQYRAVTRRNPSLFQGKIPLHDGTDLLDGVDTDKLPVEQVSWYEAVEFCNKLSELQGLTPAYTIDKTTKDPNNVSLTKSDPKWTVSFRPGSNGYRLPTEAQWEFACRAGTTTPFNTNCISPVTGQPTITTDYANYNGVPYIYGDPPGRYRERTTEVGTFAPNDWGLYDMHGNVYELCWDRMWAPVPTFGYEHENYYDSPNQTDPVGVTMSDRRVIRGGSWRHQSARCRSAYRERIQPHDTKPGNGDMGLRVVLPMEGATWHY